MAKAALSELDYRLLHALQIEPRATWSKLAPIVGADSSTLARRWERLSAEGIAWVSGVSSERQFAIIEIECELSKIGTIIEQLQHDPDMVVLDVSSGSRDLLALVYTADFEGVSSFVVQRLGAIQGIRSVQTHLANEVLTDGGAWRLRSLNASEAARIPDPRPPRRRAARYVPDEVSSAILNETKVDGRVAIATIAERNGISPQRISDGLATMRQQGSIVFRTDVARGVTEWPVYAWYFIEAPSATIEAARTSIGKIPEVRLAITAASRVNLILAVWLRKLSDINRFELALEKALTGARIADRAVVLHTARHMNRILGEDTFAIDPA